MIQRTLPDGRALEVTRRVCGFSQTYVAIGSGLTLDRLRKIESGRVQPRPSEIARILGVLSTDPDPNAE